MEEYGNFFDDEEDESPLLCGGGIQFAVWFVLALIPLPGEYDAAEVVEVPPLNCNGEF